MLNVSLLLAGFIVALGVTGLLNYLQPTSALSYIGLCVGGALVGALVGLSVGRVDPPPYDWFGFYALGQMGYGAVGGLIGAAAAVGFRRLRPLPAGAVGAAGEQPAQAGASPGRARRADLRRAGPLIALAIILLVAGAYFWMHPSRTPAYRMPELDTALVNPRLLVSGMTTDEVRLLLGEPALVARDEDYHSWYYGVRASGGIGDSRVRAPLLQITVDPAGHVASWGFFHPLTGEPLALREGELQASRWLNARCGSGDGPRVVLGQQLIPGVTTTDEVLAAFGSWSMQAWTVEHRREIFVRPLAGGGELITYPVDHPSAMYLPVMYAALSFDDDGELSSWAYAGGC